MQDTKQEKNRNLRTTFAVWLRTMQCAALGDTRSTLTEPAGFKTMWPGSTPRVHSRYEEQKRRFVAG